MTDLTPEQTRTLAELADNLAAARRIAQLLKWVGIAGTGAAALAYYVFGALLGWHNMKGN